VHSHGWDEITLDGPTHVSELVHGRIRHYRLTHKNFGLPRVPVKHLAGGDANANALAIRDILSGKKTPARDVVVANAAAVIWIAEGTLARRTRPRREAVGAAEVAIDSGAALKKLNELVNVSLTIEN